MLVYQEKYGDTIDGYYGVMRAFYKLEPSDWDDVNREVLAYLYDYDLLASELPKQITITLINPYDDEDVDFEICPKDYL